MRENTTTSYFQNKRRTLNSPLMHYELKTRKCNQSLNTISVLKTSNTAIIENTDGDFEEHSLNLLIKINCDIKIFEKTNPSYFIQGMINL